MKKKKIELHKLFPRSSATMPHAPNKHLGQMVDEVFYNSYDAFILDCYGDQAFLAMKKQEVDMECFEQGDYKEFDLGEWQLLPQFDIPVIVKVDLGDLWKDEDGTRYHDEFDFKKEFRTYKLSKLLS